MTTQPTAPKRWRPRFSVRTLVLLVTLVCCYTACWGPTKTRGVADVRAAKKLTLGENRLVTATYPIAALIITADEAYILSKPWPSLPRFVVSRHYYFWFFGYVAKLPFERNVNPALLPPRPARQIVPGNYY